MIRTLSVLTAVAALTLGGPAARAEVPLPSVAEVCATPWENDERYIMFSHADATRLCVQAEQASYDLLNYYLSSTSPGSPMNRVIAYRVNHCQTTPDNNPRYYENLLDCTTYGATGIFHGPENRMPAWARPPTRP